jgi:hypothetical protein
MTFPEHKGISKTFQVNFKTSLSQPMKTSPSEFARYLASYLEDHMSDFVKMNYYDDPVVDHLALAKLIQTFQDTFP